MEWFLKIVRIAGVNCPGAASLVQLQAELDSDEMKKRIDRLEDPISCLHEDVPLVAKEIYNNMKSVDSFQLDFSEEFYLTYSRPLAALDSVGLISKENAANSKVPVGIRLKDPSFIMYMCNLAEDPSKMIEIIDIVDRCERGISLNGKELSKSLGLPTCVIKSIFEVYSRKGYGLLSKTIGECRYRATA